MRGFHSAAYLGADALSWHAPGHARSCRPWPTAAGLLLCWYISCDRTQLHCTARGDVQLTLQYFAINAPMLRRDLSCAEGRVAGAAVAAGEADAGAPRAAHGGLWHTAGSLCPPADADFSSTTLRPMHALVLYAPLIQLFELHSRPFYQAYLKSDKIGNAQLSVTSSNTSPAHELRNGHALAIGARCCTRPRGC